MLLSSFFSPDRGNGVQKGIRHSTGLSVGFAAVPGDCAFESGDLDDKFHKVFDGDLESGSQIDRFTCVVVFGCSKYPFCRILGIQKFPAGVAGSPYENFVFLNFL